MAHGKNPDYLIAGYNEALDALTKHREKKLGTELIRALKALCSTLRCLCRDDPFWHRVGAVATASEQAALADAVQNLDVLLETVRETLQLAGVSDAGTALLVGAIRELAEYRDLPDAYGATGLRQGVERARDDVCELITPKPQPPDRSRVTKGVAVMGGAALIAAGEKSPVPGTSLVTTPLGKRLIKAAVGDYFSRPNSVFGRLFPKK